MDMEERIMPKEISIEPLSKTTLKQANQLANSIFAEEDCSPAQELCASLSYRALRDYQRKVDAKMLQLDYFVALEDDRVVGLVGLYLMKEDSNDALWLGWYCVHPTSRGKGVGTLLLEFVIEQARSRNKSYLRLYTSTDENEQTAQLLYERYGFHIYDTENLKDYQILYRQKKL
jgi:GNAT superfamily N-acetyltransferase